MSAKFFSKLNRLPLSTKSIKTQSFSATNTSSPRITKVGELAWFCVQNPDFTKFIFQCILTIIILLFCIFQLISGGRDGQGENDALYWGGITSILAWWMPSPGSSLPQNQQISFEENSSIETSSVTDTTLTTIDTNSVPQPNSDHDLA